MNSPRMEINRVIPALEERGGTIVFSGRGRVERQFQEVRRDVDAVAAHLLRAGAVPGGNVGLLAANSYEWLLVDLACLLLGCVSVPFDVRRTWQVEQLAAGYDLALLVTDVPQASGPRILNIASLLPREPSPSLAPHHFGVRDPYTVKFSSGTTAEPKALRTWAAHFDHMATHVQAQFPLGGGDRYLLLMPLSIYLQRFFVHVSILAGAGVSIGPMEQAVRLLRSERPTILVSVPQLLKSLLTVFHSRRAKDPQSPSLRDLFGGRIRYLWTGTAPIDQATLLEYEKEGIPVYEGYGMSETGLIAKNYPGARRIGSVGRLFPGKSLELGPAGEVVVRSEYHTSDRYWRGEDEGVFLPGGRVATGDVGRLDQDGFLYLIGRTREAIVLGNGFKVFPATVEQRLLSSGLFRECLVYGQGRPYLVALIVPAAVDVTDASIMEALARANEGAPLQEQVHAFLRVPESEAALRNVAGKLDRRAVHARFEAGLRLLYDQGVNVPAGNVEKSA